MKFKKHIACLFDATDERDALGRICLEVNCAYIFRYDPTAEIRVTIHGQVYFIQISDMEQAEKENA